MDLRSLGPKAWGIAALVAIGVILAANPVFVKNLIKSYKGTEVPTDLDRADFKGRAQQAYALCKEVQSRLEAYNARFNCPEAQLLDQAFLEPSSPLSIHPLRKEWFEMRREISEYLTKHRLYTQKCRAAIAAAGHPDKVEELQDFPEECMAWSADLDRAISERIQKLPMFDQVVLQLRMLGRRIR
jgi:hypothetical protein